MSTRLHTGNPADMWRSIAETLLLVAAEALLVATSRDFPLFLPVLSARRKQVAGRVSRRRSL
jgi:hypothetical protein